MWHKPLKAGVFSEAKDMIVIEPDRDVFGSARPAFAKAQQAGFADSGCFPAARLDLESCFVAGSRARIASLLSS
jgi:hypothetical protein